MKRSAAWLEIAGALALGIGVAMLWDIPPRSPEETNNAGGPVVAAASRTEGAPLFTVPKGHIEANAWRASPFKGSLLKAGAVYLQALEAARVPEEAARLLALAVAAADSDLQIAIIEGLGAGNPEWLLDNLAKLRNPGLTYAAGGAALLAQYARGGPEAAKACYARLPEAFRAGIIQEVECETAAQTGDVARLASYDSRTGAGSDANGYFAKLLARHPGLLAEVMRQQPSFRLIPGSYLNWPESTDVLRAVAATLPADAFLKWAATAGAGNFPEALMIAGGNLPVADLIVRGRSAAAGDLRTEVNLASAMARDMVRKDPAEGLRWLADLEAGSKGNLRLQSEVASAAGKFSREWVSASRAEALAAALSAGGDSTMAGEIVREAFAYGSSSEARLKEAASIADPGLKETALAAVITGGPGLTREQALPVLEQITGTRGLNSAVEKVFGNWGGTDPAGAAAWLKTNTPAYAATAIDAVFTSWAVEDATAAAGWLSGAPPGPVRDAAASRFARQVAGRDPEGALAWAAEVADANIRTGCFEHIIISLNSAGVNTNDVIGRAQLPAAVQSELNAILSR